MRRVGVLVNGNAKQAQRDPALVGRLRGRLSRDAVVVTKTPDEVGPALDALLAQPLDALVLVGGDGTMAGTLTALLASRDAEKIPPIAPSRGGTVNTIATSLGARGTPEQTVAALLRGDPFREERRAVVRVTADGEAPVCGFLFINGVGARFLELYYHDSPMGPRGALSVLTRLARSALLGGELAQRVFDPFEAEVRVDGTPLDARRFTVIGASGVRHIGLGFPVFHSAGRDPERIHLVTTNAAPAEIALALPALRAGRPTRSLAHRSAKRVEIRFPTPLPWTIDADFFPPASRLVVEAGPALRIKTPRR